MHHWTGHQPKEKILQKTRDPESESCNIRRIISKHIKLKKASTSKTTMSYLQVNI